MRILVLLTSLNTGGAEYSTLTFYGWLKKQRYEVKVVCLKKASSQFDAESFGLNNVTILSGKSFTGRWKALNSLVTIFQPDIIHSVLFEANILGRFCKFSNRKVIHLESLVNEIYSNHRLNDPHITWLKLKGYQLFDFITQLGGVDHYHANGISVARHYEKKLRINPARITIIPRGRNPNPFLHEAENRSAIRQNMRAEENTILIVSVGRHEYQKAQDVLIDALGKMQSKFNYTCIIAGREGTYTGLLKKKIESCKLQDKVILAGHRNDVAQILAAADIFVFPSRFEGLAGALIEAAAAGLPVICADIPNNREVAKENALFFEVDDAPKLTQHLEYLAQNSDRRRQMGEKSVEIFKASFLLDNIHLRMKALLDSLPEKP